MDYQFANDCLAPMSALSGQITRLRLDYFVRFHWCLMHFQPLIGPAFGKHSRVYRDVLEDKEMKPNGGGKFPFLEENIHTCVDKALIR